MTEPGPLSVERQRKTLMLGMTLGTVGAVLLWIAVHHHLVPDLPMFEGVTGRFAFAIGWLCIAALLCVLSGIEAIAHERLFTPAINPLSGHESHAMAVNRRYLQNTVEQYAIFVPGLLGLAWYADNAAVAATAVVWIAGRFAFWIGYHKGPQYRAIGLVGMMQSMLILLYIVWRFGGDVAGPVGAAVPLVLFAVIEIIVTVAALRAARS